MCGAKHNIEINLLGIKDEEFKETTRTKANNEVCLATKNRDKILKILEKRN